MEAATGPVAAEPDRGLGHDLFLRVGVSLHQLRNRANLSGRATARKVSFTEAFGSELHTAIPAFLRRLRVGLRSRQRPSRLSCARLGVHNCIAGRKKRYDQQDSQRISHHGHPATHAAAIRVHSASLCLLARAVSTSPVATLPGGPAPDRRMRLRRADHR